MILLPWTVLTLQHRHFTQESLELYASLSEEGLEAKEVAQSPSRVAVK
jgi:hypothetical protein